MIAATSPDFQSAYQIWVTLNLAGDPLWALARAFRVINPTPHALEVVLQNAIDAGELLVTRGQPANVATPGIFEYLITYNLPFTTAEEEK